MMIFRSIAQILRHEARGIVAAHEVRTKRAARRYERSEPRIARREPQKKPPFGGFFCARSGSPNERKKLKKMSFLFVILIGQYIFVIENRN